MATHSSIVAWEVLWTEILVGYSPWNLKELDMAEHSSNHHQVKKKKKKKQKQPQLKEIWRTLLTVLNFFHNSASASDWA